jgi:hypothetical protein
MVFCVGEASGPRLSVQFMPKTPGSGDAGLLCFPMLDAVQPGR